MNNKLYCINPNTKEYEEVKTIYGINIEEILDLIRDYKISKDLKFDNFGKLEEIERLNKERETDIKYNKYLQKEIAKANSIIKEVREYIENNQEEHKFTDRGGFTYTEGHFLRDSDTLLEILDKENK